MYHNIEEQAMRFILADFENLFNNWSNMTLLNFHKKYEKLLWINRRLLLVN